MPTTRTRARAKKKGIPTAGIAAGVLATAAAAGAAYYFYGSKKAGQHRRAAAKWATSLKRDVVREAKKLQKIDDVVMHEIIDRVAGTYRVAKSVDPAELKRAANELKANWKKLRAEFRGPAKKVKRAVKKTVKKMARKKRTA